MHRRVLLWLLALPLCVAGSQVAHWAAYRLVDPDPVSRALRLADTGHGYLEFAPLASAFATALILVAAFCLAVDSCGTAKVMPSLYAYALLPPLVFTFQEHLERFVHDGGYPLGAVLEPTFVLGLLLQLPFSVLAFVVARLLLRITRLLIAAVGGGGSARAGAPARDASVSPRSAEPPRGSVLGRAYAGRAPPVVA